MISVSESVIKIQYCSICVYASGFVCGITASYEDTYQ